MTECCFSHYARLGIGIVVSSFEAEADALFALAVCRASASLSASAPAFTKVPSRSSDMETDTACSNHSTLHVLGMHDDRVEASNAKATESPATRQAHVTSRGSAENHDKVHGCTSSKLFRTKKRNDPQKIHDIEMIPSSRISAKSFFLAHNPEKLVPRC